ncbi:hypothetical protein LTR37_011462 [Vermiconidia calcicola]|uniref:Uncharacterized protein n=1 Tax=Vermiconidia calcicola TaxID=1690605 RepID=A0ACC3N3C2_9PEZI|nr:hypothetical protein LTR37_011462 [Vermiconidia calcicola]
MDDSPFGKLAPELRNTIYEMTVESPDQISLWFKKSDNKTWRWSHPVQELALPATCKQIRSESLPLFFSTNTFRLSSNILNELDGPVQRCDSVSRHTQAIKIWIREIGEGAKYLRDVNIDLGQWNMFWAEAGTVSAIFRNFGDVFKDSKCPANVEAVIIVKRRIPDVFRSDYMSFELPLNDQLERRSEIKDTIGRMYVRLAKMKREWEEDESEDYANRVAQDVRLELQDVHRMLDLI